MSYPHRIRLRGPWECEPAGQPSRRAIMPGRWADLGQPGFRGVAKLTRRFGYPGRADSSIEHIWLTGSACIGFQRIHLNSQLLADAMQGDFAFDVTHILADRNVLMLEIEGRRDDLPLWDEIALEIRRDAYLTDMGIERSGTNLIVRGKAAGTSPQPLELYVLVDNRNVDYRTIQPRSDGEPFRIELVDLPATCQLVRVEMVHISSIWYAVEMPIPGWQPD